MEGCLHRAQNIGELDDLVRNLSTEGFRIISVLDSNGAYIVVAQREVQIAFLNPPEIPFEIAFGSKGNMVPKPDYDHLGRRISAGHAEILPDYP